MGHRCPGRPAFRSALFQLLPSPFTSVSAPIRIYGFGDFQPAGYCFCASSFDTLPLMITSSPGFQFAGVETSCFRGELERVQHAQDFVEIAAGAHGIASA